MSNIPSPFLPDSTVELLLNGYQFISKQSQQLQSDIFETRLALEKTICFRGAEAAKVFYDTEKFTREGSAPKRVQKTLFGEGGVQGLNGKAHRHRKQMFMTLMSSKQIEALADITQKQWQTQAQHWTTEDQIVLFSEAREVLAQAVCNWAGVPLPSDQIKQRTHELAAMIEGSGAIGPKHWQGKRARQQVEDWIRDLIGRVRQQQITPPTGSALAVIAWHRDLEGELLTEQIAAVELINVLRPTLAIARYVMFAALALYEHPEEAHKLKDSDQYLEWFVQEVRRFYPFFPFAAARVKHSFEWQDYTFMKGQRVLLDLYGTNHDERLWPDPESFAPERFRQWDEGRFDFIPQGGGDFYLNHRCPGEWITIALMKTSLQFLTEAITYEVPPQNLHVNLSQMPAFPQSQFVISQVRFHQAEENSIKENSIKM